MRIVVAALVAGLAALAAEANAAEANFFKPPAGCPHVQPHAGTTSGDWEAVFAERKQRSSAIALVRTVRRKGFRCAVFERERHIYEVAVIGLRPRSQALTVVLRARRKGIAAYVTRS